MQRISGPAFITRARAPGILSPAQAADYLGLSLPALQELVDRGELRPEPGDDGCAPGFTTSALDAYLSAQQARAVVTGKLTLPLQFSVDVPGLLSTMVGLRDERQAAEALAGEAARLAGVRCPATLVLRADDVLQTLRLLAVAGGAGPGEAALDALTAAGEAEYDTLSGPLQQLISEHRAGETVEVGALLAPLLGERAGLAVARLALAGALVCPLLRIGPVRWVLVVLLQDAPSRLAGQTREAIEALGIQASVALEAVRLRNDVLQRANRAEALYSTVRMLARAEDSGALLANVASQAARLLAADGAVVLIVDREGASFTAGATTGLDEDSVSWSATLSAEFLVGWATGVTRPLQVTDAARASALELPRLAGDRQARSAICAPIIHKGVLLGAVEVYGARPRSFGEEDQSLLVAFAHQAAIAIDAMRGQEVRRRALLGAVEALASANEARDGYTGQHCKRLARLAVIVARALGFEEEEVERIGLAAALHDIGKIAVPDAILRKPDKLTPAEREIINLHPTTGEEIVARVPELQDVALMIGAHQERWDGAGYPRGLAGEAIPIGARIIAVVDTYAALVEDRPYRDGAPHEAALRELERSAGSQLDPLVVELFVRHGDEIRALMASDETDTLDWPTASGRAPRHPVIEAAGADGRAPVARDHDAELAALRAAVHAIAAVRDPRAMYDELRGQLAQLLEYDALLVLLAEPTPAGLRQLPELRQSAWFPPVGNPIADGVIATVARLKRALWINDYLEYAAERDLPLPADAVLVGTPRAIVAVPLIVDEEFCGVLSLQALHPAAYDRHHVELLEEVALHLALAIRYGESRALADPPRRPLARRLADRLATVTSAAEAATLFVEEARQALPCESCLLYLLRAGQPELAATDDGWSDTERLALARQQPPRGQGLVWAAIDAGAPLVVPDLSRDPRGAALLRPPLPNESGLLLPLVSRGQVVAVAQLTRVGEPFTAADANALAVSATPVAATLAELAARELEQQRVRELATLQRAMALVEEAAARGEPLSAIAGALVDACGYRRAAVYRHAGSALELQATAGDEPAPARLPLDEGAHAEALRERRALLHAGDGASGDAAAVIRGEVIVPLALPGGVDGVLVAGNGRERALGEWDCALLEQFAHQAGLALRRARPAPTGALAAIDALTGLLSQQAFAERLARGVAQAVARGEPLALLFLDLDHFKLANDAFGHRFGDELLRYLGERLPQELPDGALVGRYGGEEFVIMLPNTPLRAAEQLGNRLRCEMAEREFTTSAGHRVILSMSVGIAALAPDGDDPRDADALLHAADRAMYLAKRTGRNRVVTWSAATRDALARLH